MISVKMSGSTVIISWQSGNRKDMDQIEAAGVTDDFSHHGVRRCLRVPVRDLLSGSLDQSDHPPAISSPTTSAYHNGLYPRGGEIYGTGF